MRAIAITAFVLISLASCKQGETKNIPPFKPTENLFVEKVDSANFTQIKWLDADQDLGKVNEGEQVPVSFKFTNAGEKPLIIYSVQPACGCTAAEPPKEPILPGKDGVITASFNSNGRVGTNSKSITVRANTTESMEHNLHFKVEVIKKQTP